MPSHKGGEDPPGSPTPFICTRVPNDGDPGCALLTDENALEAIVQMETGATAPRTRDWPVAVSVSHPLLMYGKVMHVVGDQRAPVKTSPARLN